MPTVASEVKKHKFKPTPQVLAALHFGMAALGPIGSWIILLFHATPPSQSTFEAAAYQLRFVFSVDSPAPWWFLGWAVLPFVLFGFALYSLISMSDRKSTMSLFLASLVVSVVSLYFYWPVVAVLAAGGSFNAFRCYRLATS
jgi:hypothetical protein